MSTSSRSSGPNFPKDVESSTKLRIHSSVFSPDGQHPATQDLSRLTSCNFIIINVHFSSSPAVDASVINLLLL